MADSYPSSLRPGGPSPSTTPRPESQPQPQHPQSSSSQPPTETVVDTNVHDPNPSSMYNAYQEQPQGGPSQGVYGSGGRYASAAYPNNAFNVETPGGTQGSLPFQPEEHQRSRTSTLNQNYAAPIGGIDQQAQSPPAMPAAQPLFAQHSGPGPAGPSGSRPVSRQQPQTQPANPAFGQTSFPPISGTRPGTGGSQHKSPFTSPVTSPPRGRPSQILLINPTSTTALTNSMLAALRPILPPQLEVVGYTAHYPAPTATETTVDMALSTELVLRDLAKYATNNGETVQNFDALLVASFTNHPLINALRESYDVPVIGVMEGSLYVSRMLGARFGILATTNRHKIQQDDAIHALGLGHFYVGSEAVHMSPLEILASGTTTQTGQVSEEVAKRISHAARTLVIKGADTLILGSEAMCTPEVVRAAKDAIREEDGRRTINVVDCIEAGVMCLNGLVGMGVPTSKKGMYRGEREGRRARGQNWL